jgi:hypothetical protein
MSYPRVPMGRGQAVTDIVPQFGAVNPTKRLVLGGIGMST